MEQDFWWMLMTVLIGGCVASVWLLKRANEWFFVSRLGENKYVLPPGDMGWPVIGNMLSFFIAFKFGNPESFISNFATRFGRTGIYKAFMFGSPSIILTRPEMCRQVLLDGQIFKTGWPKVACELVGRNSFLGLHGEEHKRLRRLTAAPISGNKALATYHEHIKDVVTTALDEWASREEPIEFINELRIMTFRIIMHIFMSVESDPILETSEKLYRELNQGIRALGINLPGFAYHKALKARKKLVRILQAAVDGRRARKKVDSSEKDQDMMDMLLEIEDENGKRLDDEEIIDLILMYLNAGHESTALAMMWATLFLEQNPEYLSKAKAEQEEIVSRRKSTEGLSFQEIKQMEYLPKVIDETLRTINISAFTFRQATCDTNIGGYTIPKGWKVLVWFRAVHLDSGNYSNPKVFDPSRWNEYKPKAGSYLPFGAGSRLEQVNPECSLIYLPHIRPANNCLAKIIKVRPSSS
ncbi:hypothetical protein Tsubulata_039667 [Turnera subulata]|uniref:Ent-kaurenoic acid oxidase n=1 Tax=Turnera subulata TaxID=218843 RepID=A0A9Q0FGZ8_9ROSI|nr:hypothetical protein Tsubulata_039667 [Turnera subulata]